MKLGVVGISWITDAFLEASLKEGYELVAVNSRRFDTALEFAKKYGLTSDNVYTSVEEMAKKSGIEVVYIATPNKFHVPYGKVFASHKIHVISEKPISVEKKELEELDEVCRTNNVYYFEAMRPVHHVNLVEFKKMLANSDVIRYCYLNFMKYSSTYDKFKEGIITPRFDPAFKGGALNDLGVYPIYVAYYLFGKPQDKKIEVTRLHNGIDATCTVTLIYDTFNCVISASKVSNSFLVNEIQTESKTYHIDHITGLSKFSAIDIKTGEEEILIDKKIPDDMRFEARDFREIIENKDNERFQFYKNLSMDVVCCLEELHQMLGE